MLHRRAPISPVYVRYRQRPASAAARNAMRFDCIWTDARLATLAPGRPGLGIVEHGALAARDGRIAFAGPSADLPAAWDAVDRVRLDGRWITPGLVDCHTHLVYAGDRAHEFELRLAGASYEAIARAGGGILSTVRGDPGGERGRSGGADASPARSLAGGRRHHRGDQVGLRPRSGDRDANAARRAPPGARAQGRRRHQLSRRTCASAGGGRRQGALYRRGLRHDRPDRARPARRRGRRILRKDRLFSGADRARIRGRPGAPACRSSFMPTSSPTCTALDWPPSTARCPPIISSTPTRRASPPWRAPGPSRFCFRAHSTC